MKAFYITTAIDYANGSPHIGHAYEKVLADVITRYRRLLGEPVYFLTGLDEHGQKVQQSAQRQGIEPIAFCDAVAAEFQDLCQTLVITNDAFIRTTQEHHKQTVAQILQQLYDQGEIYQADYSGYYSVRAEQFLQEKDKVDGHWPDIFGEVIEITESNYFFKLSAYQEWLIDYLNTHQEFIYPHYRTRDVLEFLKEPINDLCISRPKERLRWGIPLPFDPNYVTYVWFDALVNYLSAVGYGKSSFEQHWPADVHVIGKDILVPPHAVYWPIMLKACGLPLPKQLLVHGWWLSAGEKLSKSGGQQVNPLDWLHTLGADAFRYFLIREMTIGQDSEFSEALILNRYHSDLANDLGNLVSRLLNMVQRYCGGVLPRVSVGEQPEQALQEQWAQTHRETLDYYGQYQFHTGLETTFRFIRAINRYIEIRSPWKLARSEDEADRQRLEMALATVAEALRLAAVILAPIMPTTTERIHRLLGLEPIKLWDCELAWSTRLNGNTVGKQTILFPKIEDGKPLG